MANQSVLTMPLFHFLFILLTTHFCFASNECGEGQNVNPFPWNVGIYADNQKNVELICFGTAIKKNVIITAAHCFTDNLSGKVRNNTFYVATGKLSKNFNINNVNIVQIDTNQIYINKHFKGLSNGFMDDLAIINIKHIDNISPVCVDWDQTIIDINEGRQPIWQSANAINAKVEYISYEDCLWEVPAEYKLFVTPDKNCIKTKKLKPDQQSNGSGVVYQNKEYNLWYLKGVISTQENSEGTIFTYTKIEQNLNWISNIVAKL